jgi:hypothetical protein
MFTDISEECADLHLPSRRIRLFDPEEAGLLIPPEHW